MDRHMIVFGCGFSGFAISRAALAQGWRVSVTSRNPANAAAPEGVEVIRFDDAGPAIASATHLVSTVAPDFQGDPVLRTHGEAIAHAENLKWAGYLSTTGVYGDRQGGWVDEDTQPAPGSGRSRRRLEAERAWGALAEKIAVDIFRTAGIYGPGRSALDDLRAGRARRIEKLGHAFGRVHRDDIAGAVLAAAAQPHEKPSTRILHLADDTPSGPADVIAEAARLLGVEPPAIVSFSEAAPGMSDMARSFWAENRKIASAKTQAAIGRRWRYPSYREGLSAILAEESGDRPA